MYGLEHHPLFSVAFPLAWWQPTLWSSPGPLRVLLMAPFLLSSFFGFCDAIFSCLAFTLVYCSCSFSLWVNVVVSWVLFPDLFPVDSLPERRWFFLERNWAWNLQFAKLNIDWPGRIMKAEEWGINKWCVGFWHRNRKHNNIRKQGLCWEFLW